MKKLRHEAIFFMLPGILGTLLFFVIPFIGSLYYVVHSDTFPPRFVGGQNLYSLINNRIFLSALWNTFRFSLICAPLTVALAFCNACLLSKNFDVNNALKAFLLIPYILPTAATVSIWRILFGYNSSLAYILSQSLGARIDLLQGDQQIVPICLLYLWRNIGFFTVILISAIQAIPTDLYEYANLEGASSIQKHSRITLPAITPSLLITFLFSWTGALKVFKEVYSLSGGYPPSSLYTLQHFINNQMQKLNYSTTITAAYVFSLIIIIVFTILFFLEQISREACGR